jgi:F0F1-type ATP synthase membrane subunit b/b'
MAEINIIERLFEGGVVGMVLGVIFATLAVVSFAYKFHLKEIEKITGKYEKRITALEQEVKEAKREIDESKLDRESLRSENTRLNNILLMVLGAEKLQSIKSML